MAVHTLRNFMNLQSSDLSNLALEMLDAEDAAFVLVSPGGDIISQTAGQGGCSKACRCGRWARCSASVPRRR